MLSRMVPSSPPDMRTLHLLKLPDILLANDRHPNGSHRIANSGEPQPLVERDLPTNGGPLGQLRNCWPSMPLHIVEQPVAAPGTRGSLIREQTTKKDLLTLVPCALEISVSEIRF